MKRVSFETAKALKEAGYPQIGEYWYDGSGLCCYSESDVDEIGYIFSPTYVEVWLWLWREKGLRLSIEYTRATETEYESWCTLNQEHLCNLPVSNGDPEEAIEKSIKYIIDNDLIK